MGKPTFWFPTLYDTNQAVQLQKMARGLKFRIYEGHSRINDNEFISRQVLLESVCFVMSYEDTYITDLCLKFDAFIMASFDAMII